MPSLSLLATSPPLLSAALAAMAPADAPAPVMPGVAPVVWTLAPSQAAAGPPDTPPPADEGPGNEIVVEGDYGPPKSDPAERINEESYRITQAVDEAVVEPIAYAYRDGLPGPIRDGLGNVVRNLGEPSNALNFLLQGKVGKAFETLGRLAINSTIGIGGLIDVAGKPGIGLPYRRNGFANTFGYYGVGSGPYLYLPVTGATTVRDLVGNTLDQALLPFAVGAPFNKTEYAVPYFIVNGLDQRLAYDAEIAKIQASDDPYMVRRETYLARRRRDIALLKGEPVSEEDQYWLEELEGPPPAPEPATSTGPVEPPANPEALLITRPERLPPDADGPAQGR